MLDLTVLIRRLTQGQPPAGMALASLGAPNVPPAAAAQVSATPMPQTEAASVDPHEVARRVYELLRRDLAVERVRRGVF